MIMKTTAQIASTLLAIGHVNAAAAPKVDDVGVAGLVHGRFLTNVRENYPR